MSLFDASTIERFSQEGEGAFATEYPCILERISVATTSGLAKYTLPDTVISIRRVTWRGYKLDPLPQRSMRDCFQNATQIGRPFWYVFNNIGLNKIQFFPIPNETLAASTTGLYSTEIANCVIVEYWRTPDFVAPSYESYHREYLNDPAALSGSGTVLGAIIPTFIRKRLLKCYVMRGCFNIEGQGQSLKNVKYWKAKWDSLKLRYGLLLMELHNKPRKLVVNSISASYYFPGTPVLPMERFGISVETGE